MRDPLRTSVKVVNLPLKTLPWPHRTESTHHDPDDGRGSALCCPSSPLTLPLLMPSSHTDLPLFLNGAKPVLATGALHSLCLLRGTVFPQKSTSLVPLHHPGLLLQYFLILKTFLVYTIQNSLSPKPQPLSPCSITGTGYSVTAGTMSVLLTVACWCQNRARHTVSVQYLLHE